jgi:multidrug efflux pump subunit AcrA (membrane-fusion protein)
MYTETRLSLRERKDVLTIPLEAVSRNGEDASVLAVNGQNVVEARKLRLGAEDSVRVEVLAGLSEGERVIIGNRSEYHEGQKVQTKDVSEAAGSGKEN